VNAETTLLQRRRISPVKLRQARLAAGLTNISDVVRRANILPGTLYRWEDPSQPGLAHFDYVGFENLLRLYGCTFENVTDAPEAGEVLRPGAVHFKKAQTPAEVLA